MPQIADITVKKNDGTTDITYTAYLASAGDKAPAVWRSTTVGGAQAHHPELRIVARDNGSKTARRVDMSYSYKQLATDSTNGLTSVVNTVPISVSAAIPGGMPQSDIDEAVSQFFNLGASTLVKQCFKVAFSAT